MKKIIGESQPDYNAEKGNRWSDSENLLPYETLGSDGDVRSTGYSPDLVIPAVPLNEGTEYPQERGAGLAYDPVDVANAEGSWTQFF